MGYEKQKFHVMNYERGKGWGFKCWNTEGMAFDEPWDFSDAVLKKGGEIVMDGVKIRYDGRCPGCNAYVVNPSVASGFLEAKGRALL